MASGFPGFSEEAFRFFRGLVRNNRREWFLPRKPIFEEHVKEPMFELVRQLNLSMRSFAPDYVTEPSKAVYRFYRDTRFSADKSPYKTQIAASFPHRGVPAGAGAGFYFAVSHQHLAVGGGVYMPPPETLRAIRGHLAEHHGGLRRIVKTPSIRRLLGELHGEQLSRTPKGFPADHPAADLLRFKMYLLYVELPAELARTAAIHSEIVKRFRAMAPFLNFLNTPLLAQPKKIVPL
jgi:uncharacterized protein (TIGR02453 family)